MKVEPLKMFNIVFTKYVFEKFYLGRGAAGIPPAPFLGCASDCE
jgi:hypothetical protein